MGSMIVPLVAQKQFVMVAENVLVQHDTLLSEALLTQQARIGKPTCFATLFEDPPTFLVAT
jgi:hypothetical protein